ncbi:transcriptional regulator, TetR family [Desulfatibacillum alkenivorans DSM 16219]|jgi:AcrR family transcriptional regulator|uniref:Transcriptional regulator, TetR family n=1 Tax=Desulfatibacillum alkenivorans DSM 16219 TaxID=1121393 RepID=A0A1M6U2I6_9BACT|nr:TetR/AcrR family transcriptional regulator [Desulfatibacillum alkenivorans]SHK63373.1 transcriptional regulator, TetR family [Desulfatibacillum alkenivorans DSM 16219]
MKNPTRNREATRLKLINAVGQVLAEKGFTHLGVNAVARQAGVDKVLIYRYFGGMPGLIKAFGQEGDFWPSMEELAGGNIDAYRVLPLEEKLKIMGRNYLKGIRKRPLTQEIMAWEMVERNNLTEELEIIRETRMLRFAELFLQVGEETVDVMAVVGLMGAGLSYLICRSRRIRWYNGIDLENQEGWKRLENGIDLVVEGVARLMQARD